MSEQGSAVDNEKRDLECPTLQEPSPEEEQLPPTARQEIGKVISTNYTSFMAGMNDAAIGVLIPYLQPAYNIGLMTVSFVYLVNFAGWLSASFTNIHVCSRVGTGGTLILGAMIQTFGYALMLWKPPFPLFAAAFFFTGMGEAFQDAQANSFIITIRNPHRWLGLLHAIYGVGTVVSPLVANTMASRTPYWHYYYLITMCLGIINITLLAWTFRQGLFRPNVQGAKDTANSELKATLTSKTVWILNGFFLLYVGAEVTAGGWLVEFLVSVRHGKASRVGYIASAFWSGFALGRVALAEVTHRWGERRMIFVYLAIALAMQLMFWLIPNIAANAVTVCILGTLKIVPKELHIGALGFTASLGQAGSAAFPFMTGAVASKAGVEVLQPIMVGLLVGIAVFWALIPKQKSYS